MAKILFVAKRKSNGNDNEVVHEVYYDSGRFYLFYGADKVPKTVQRFMDTATRVDNIWNRLHRRREIVYKA